MEAVDPVSYSFLVTVPLVFSALGYFVDSWLRDSAKPLQHRGARGDAFGAIPLDHELLRASRGGWQRVAEARLETTCLFWCPCPRRDCTIRSWTLDGQPYSPS